MKRVFLLLSLFVSFPLFSEVEGTQFVWGWQTVFTLFLLILTFSLLIKEVFPADLTLFGSAVLFVITGIVQPIHFLQGFSKDVLFTLAFLFILARGLEFNGFLELVRPYILPKSKGSFTQLLRLLFPLAGASAFLNNTPIVLIFTPLVRKWALEKNRFPSKYLIPLSYATILGGVCTLIGTSVNLVVDGLLRELEIGESIRFFDLAWIGVPCALVGILFIATVGVYLLPKRKDPSATMESYVEELSHEFSIEESCPLIDRTLSEVSQHYFNGAQIIEIHRNKHVIEAPSSHEWLQVGDRLVFLGTVEQIAKIHGIKGLKSFADPSFTLDSSSIHYSEVVVSFTSSLVGKTLSKINFRVSYGASVMAIFRAGRPLKGKLSSIPLHAGDTLMLLSSTEHFPAENFSNDFYLTKNNQTFKKITWWKCAWPLFILIAMITTVLNGVPLLYASFGGACCLLISRNLSFKEAGKAVQWHLLLLIASAYVLGQAVMVTGIADAIAKGLLPLLGSNPYALIGGILLLTLLFTEVITNTAAALLIFPIAVEIMFLSGYQEPIAYKAAAITVAVGASCSFITPIGYQTNTIVYGPGGYRFLDYAKVGFPLTVLIWCIATFLIPNIWAF